MAFRLLRYALVAMQHHLEADHKRLSLVIPILFYTGKRSPYTTRRLDELNDPALEPLPRSRMQASGFMRSTRPSVAYFSSVNGL